MSYRIVYAGVSHVGNCRKMNQDNFICGRQYMEADNSGTNGLLQGIAEGCELPWFGVFDGMGGEEKGEVAAYLAAETAYQTQRKIKGVRRLAMASRGKTVLGGSLSGLLQDFCRDANRVICTYAEENHVSAMGTTAAVMVFSKKQVHFCNVGDSKILHFREGALRQLSMDHVMMAAHRKKPVLYQNLGIAESEMIIEPYLGVRKLSEGDIYLVCSDGLTDIVTMEEIEQVLSRMPIEEAVDSLLQQVLDRGAKDNITMILCKIEQ